MRLLLIISFLFCTSCISEKRVIRIIQKYEEVKNYPPGEIHPPIRYPFPIIIKKDTTIYNK